MYWRPEPIRPPSPSLNGSSMRPSAPPSLLSTMPVRRWTVRIPAASALAVAASHATHTSERKLPGRRRRARLGEHLVAAVAVEADRAPRHEHRRLRRQPGDRGRDQLGAPHAALEDPLLLLRRPLLLAEALAREVHHRVDAVERVAVDRPGHRIPPHVGIRSAPDRDDRSPRARKRRASAVPISPLAPVIATSMTAPRVGARRVRADATVGGVGAGVH